MEKYRLPYYGKTMSFKSLEETDNHYIANYYVNKNDSVSVKHPKVKKALLRIEDDYYEDLDEFLTKSQEKYLAFKEDRRVKNCNYNLKLMTLLSILSLGALSTLVTGLFLDNAFVLIVGILSTIIFSPAGAAVIVSIKDYHFYKNALKFINSYDLLKERVKKHHRLTKGNNRPVFTPISTLEQPISLEKNKTKTLEKKL